MSRLSILLCLCFTSMAWAVELSDIKSVALGNLSALNKMKGKEYCMTRSMPPADMPPINNLSGIEVVFEDGVKTRMIPIDVSEEICTKSEPPTCSVEVTMLYQKKTSTGYQLQVTKRTISQSEHKTLWYADSGKAYGVSKMSNSNGSTFFSSMDSMAPCQLPNLMNNDPALKKLLQKSGSSNVNYDRSLKSDQDGAETAR